MRLPTPSLPGTQALYLVSDSQAHELRCASWEDHRGLCEECYNSSLPPRQQIQAYPCHLI